MKRLLTALVILSTFSVAEHVAGAPQGAAVSEKIAWFGTLESARKEAARTNRPILLLAARPCVRGVPGFW